VRRFDVYQTHRKIPCMGQSSKKSAQQLRRGNGQKPVLCGNLGLTFSRAWRMAARSGHTKIGRKTTGDNKSNRFAVSWRWFPCTLQLYAAGRRKERRNDNYFLENGRKGCLKRFGSRIESAPAFDSVDCPPCQPRRLRSVQKTECRAAAPVWPKSL
jgi:hypothetical protein